MKIIFLFLFFLVSSWAQSLSDLLPWMGLNKDVRFGMPLAEFRENNKEAQNLGFSDEEIDEDYEGGFYEDSVVSPQIGSSKGFLLYNFLEGRLVAVYWTNKEEQSLVLTEKIRAKLWRDHGEPELFFTAKTQGEAVAKVQNEIFTSSAENSQKIILRSATDGLEVSVIDFSLETRESFEGLFESYEKNAQRLKDGGMRELGAEGEIVDYLAESRSALPVPSKSERETTESNEDLSLEEVAFNYGKKYGITKDMKVTMNKGSNGDKGSNGVTIFKWYPKEEKEFEEALARNHYGFLVGVIIDNETKEFIGYILPFR